MIAFQTQLGDRIEIAAKRQGARVHLDSIVQGRFGAPPARSIRLAQLLLRRAEIEPAAAPIVSAPVATGTSAFAGIAAATNETLVLRQCNHEAERPRAACARRSRRGYGLRRDGAVEDARAIEVADGGAAVVIGGKRWRVQR